MLSSPRFFSLLCLIVFFGFSCEVRAAVPTPAPIIAGGSGVNLGITKVLAEAFKAKHPKIEITVPGSIGTKGAITAIKDKAITFGLISRPLKEKEQSPDYVTEAYARTAIVLAVHPTVHDDAVTSADVVAIYKGTKTKWGDGSEIIVQSREAFDSGFMVLEERIPGFKEACDESRAAERWATYFTDQEANQALAKTPHAIGVTDLGMMVTEHLDVKPLTLDGVSPNVETITEGSYPLSRTLFLLYRPQNLSAEARAFKDFIFSREGAALLKANGYQPLAEVGQL